MPFTFQPLEVAGAVLITPRVFPDGRGFFLESYKASDFAAAGVTEPFVQENHSSSARGVLRGLHFQRSPHAQGKLVQALQGEIFDVYVDLRRDSPTFGRWHGEVLSADNRLMLYIPPWCAHGFCVLSEEAHVQYKVTSEYAPDAEGGVAWDDPDVGIDWPVAEPLLSPRDEAWPRLCDLRLEFAAAQPERQPVGGRRDA
jgi:dTDP-4-dehydrorhamnose 3,5-epimerase